MDIGFALLVVLVVGVPIWLSRGMRNRLKERLAPVEARSTTVVLSQAPAPAAIPRPSLLSQVVIRTGHEGNMRRFSKDGASGDGMDGNDHCGVAHGHAHGDGHG